MMALARQGAIVARGAGQAGAVQCDRREGQKMLAWVLGHLARGEASQARIEADAEFATMTLIGPAGLTRLGTIPRRSAAAVACAARAAADGQPGDGLSGPSFEARIEASVPNQLVVLLSLDQGRP